MLASLYSEPCLCSVAPAQQPTSATCAVSSAVLWLAKSSQTQDTYTNFSSFLAGEDAKVRSLLLRLSIWTHSSCHLYRP